MRVAALKAGTSTTTLAAKSYRLLRAILSTAVAEDELIGVNPCRIRGAGEEHAAEQRVLVPRAGLRPHRSDVRTLAGLPAAQDLSVLRWDEITALTRADLDLEG